jgi:hypothetical protein
VFLVKIYSTTCVSAWYYKLQSSLDMCCLAWTFEAIDIVSKLLLEIGSHDKWCSGSL